MIVIHRILYVFEQNELWSLQVKLWCTINEPRMLALGYSNNPDWAPAIGNTVYGVGEYMAWHNLLLAHSAAYKIYKNSFKAQQQGEFTCFTHTQTFKCTVQSKKKKTISNNTCMSVHNFNYSYRNKK